jgi:CBS domain-containing protein
MEQDARTICVKDIMTKAVVSIDAAATITDAAKMMEDIEIGAIVVTENNTPVGIVTDRDFAIKVVAHAYPPTTPVRKIMSAPLYSISPDEPVRMIADFMYTRRIRKLPVIDQDKVIGIVTATDLVRQFAMCTGDDLKKMYCESIVRIYEYCSPYT